jgi:hypothetical protein
MAYTPKTSSEAVKKATGKGWHEWFAILDKAGAKKLDHTAIADLVYKKHLKHHKTGWWAQMVTVEYERSRGLRAVNQNKQGFAVTIHKTHGVPVGKLFAAWRAYAKKQKLIESTVHEGKTVRYKRQGGGPLIVAAFSPMKSGSRIGLDITHLPNAGDVDKERKRWRTVLDALV